MGMRSLLTKKFGGLVGVEEVDDVDSEIPLQPNNIVIGTMEDLHNLGIRKSLVQ